MSSFIERKWIKIPRPEGWSHEIKRADVYLTSPSVDSSIVIVCLKYRTGEMDWEDVEKYSQNHLQKGFSKETLTHDLWKGYELKKIENFTCSVSWHMFSGRLLLLVSATDNIPTKDLASFGGIALGIMVTEEGQRLEME